ncbi:MAG: hypothetical protein ACFHWX_05405 [Bacteroidota bacterium]
MRKVAITLISALILLSSCEEKKGKSISAQPFYQDVPYLQDFAIKFYPNEDIQFHKAYTDRNGVTQILSSNGLLRPTNGHFQYPGTLEPDITYRPMADKKVLDMITYQNQFVYLNDKAVFSNAWAGKLYLEHGMGDPEMVTGGLDFQFLVTSQKDFRIIGENILQIGSLEDPILETQFSKGKYYLLTNTSIHEIDGKTFEVKQLFGGDGLTSFDLLPNDQIAIGTNNGYLIIDQNGKIAKELDSKLPWTEISTIKFLNGSLWFGSTKGAFMIKDDGKFNYYYGERWLPGKVVSNLSEGPDGSILILTDKGLGQICFQMMTLEDKAMVFEKQVRERHIRYGINSNVSRLSDHKLSTAQNGIADSDNLWTGMYLGSQLFRYLVTGSEDAKQNCYEAFEAMERLHEINNIQGLFGRTFERSGYYEFHKEYRTYVENYWYEGYNNTVSWQHADDPEWDWRASASSDQAVGQIFAMILVAEYIDDEAWKQRAIKIIDDFMGYIVENNYMLVDVDGKPSLWGRWNPEYVNRFQTMIGDRKVYSSNLIAFLQAAYKFTGKEIYKEKARELMTEHGYLENLARPFSEIGNAPEDADNWSKMLSEEWNHSDDEMYFLAYWGLYPYAFDDSLKSVYQEAIRDHWDFERPEKNSLWNFCYAMTGAKDFDLEESVWHLKEFPLDLIEYETLNSHRKDITFREDPGFRGQYTEEVLPPDERPELKHNRNLFKLDAGDRRSELSAGDTYLLPYWMGRFLGVISAPVE